MNNDRQQLWHTAMTKGVEAFNQKAIHNAISYFRKATEILPQDASAWINLCTASLAAQQYNNALKAAEKAVSLAPNMAPAQMMLGDALRECHRQSEALDAYKKAVELQPVPLALNKLGCALREEKQYSNAEELFLRALSMAPEYPTAKINLITSAIIQQQMPVALERFDRYKDDAYPPVEKRELQECRILLNEYTRLAPCLKEMTSNNTRTSVYESLKNVPPVLMQTDTALYQPIKVFAESALKLQNSPAQHSWQPPVDWMEIEALFMIPLIDSAESYLDFKQRLPSIKDDFEVRESLNLIAGIEQARKDRSNLQDPIMAETCFRHWHTIATRGLGGFMPGHFKYADNVLNSDISMPRARAMQTTQTFRQFVSDCYLSLPPGLTRAALVLFAVIEIHPFIDGNGRSALIWLNRELEWAGLVPASFSREMGFKGELGKARRYVRRNPHDITPLLEAIQAGQDLTLSLCKTLSELESKR